MSDAEPGWLLRLARSIRGMFARDVPSGMPGSWSTLPALTVDADGWLDGAGVTHVPMHPSWRYGSLWTPNGKPLAVVAHYTATAPGTGMVMARRRQTPLAKDDRKASWHITIEADGSIIQMAPADVGCWHAVGLIKGLGGAANRVSVGIELVGFGKAFPEAQVASACRVWRALIRAYQIERKWAGVGHVDIDPARRSDPGPVWAKLHRERVLDFAYAEP